MRENRIAQSEKTKNNLQMHEDAPASREAGRIVLECLKKSALFFTAALPKHIFPPLFNCYGGTTNVFGNHVDNAVHTERATGKHIRTDLSATLFLSDPSDYDGGELVIEGSFGTQSIKLPAGDLILYPGTSVHRVEPVTRSARVASFFWIESMVREDIRRQVLFDLDMSILGLRSCAPSLSAIRASHKLIATRSIQIAARSAASPTHSTMSGFSRAISARNLRGARANEVGSSAVTTSRLPLHPAT